MAHHRNVDAVCVPAALVEAAHSTTVGPESARLQEKALARDAIVQASWRLVASSVEAGLLKVKGIAAADADQTRRLAEAPFPSPASSGRAFEMDSSVLRQLDGLCAAILGGGYRLERDVLAGPGRSICKFVGREPWEALSSFTGLYMGELAAMGSWVAMAAAHHACGVFVVPRRPGCSPWIAVKGKKRPQGGRFPATQRGWFDHLLLHARMTFEVSAEAFVPRPKEEMVVVLANFAYVGKFRSKQRKEKLLSVPVVSELRVGLGGLGPIPCVLTQVSPLAYNPDPAKDDKRNEEAATEVSPSPPIQAASRWPSGLIARWGATYPHRKVVDLAVEAAGEGIDAFRGTMGKMVRAKSGLTDEQSRQCREQLMADAGELPPRVWGPSRLPPFARFRECPMFPIKKDKNDPACSKIRLISNHSKYGARSVNAGCYSPKFLSFFCGPGHIRDRVAACGRGCLAWTADIPACFRRQAVLAKNMHLLVYFLRTDEFGDEYFCDLATPFGWVPSEYGWQAILAVLMWHFRQLGHGDMLAYVDNFFKIVPRCEVAEFEAVCANLERAFEEGGIALHERMIGTTFKGLGWVWDLVAWVMICPEKKFASIFSLVCEWAGRVVMSLLELQSCVGLLQWLSAGFPSGKADVAFLIHLRTRGERQQRNQGRSPQHIEVKVSKQAGESLRFWAAFLKSWDRRCPIFEGFSPHATWQALGRADACTDWGCGGVLLCPDGRGGLMMRAFLHKWTAAERERAFVTERESTGILEMEGALRWLSLFASELTGLRVQLELDNASAVLALDSCYSQNSKMMGIVRKFRETMCSHHICLRTRFILSEINAIADALSHGRLEEARWFARRDFGLELEISQR